MEFQVLPWCMFVASPTLWNVMTGTIVPMVDQWNADTCTCSNVPSNGETPCPCSCVQMKDPPALVPTVKQWNASPCPCSHASSNEGTPCPCSHVQTKEHLPLSLFTCPLTKEHRPLSLFSCLQTKEHHPLSFVLMPSNKGTLAFVLVPMPHCTNLYNRTHVWLMHCFDGHSQSSDHVPKKLMLWVRKKMMVLQYLARQTLQILTIESKWGHCGRLPFEWRSNILTFWY
jgi:hypothetical protein